MTAHFFMAARCSTRVRSPAKSDIVRGEHFRPPRGIAGYKRISEKNMNVGSERQLTLQSVEPGLTPRYFAGPEDQPQQHNVAHRRAISFAVCACAAFPGSGRIHVR
jgi:hypothetical protein